MLLALSLGCINQWLYERLPQPHLSDLPPPQGLSSLSAEDCGLCHTAIYEEWRHSQMAGSWSDPVFQKDWADNQQFYSCLACHTPVPAQLPLLPLRLSSLTPLRIEGSPNPGYDPRLTHEGVTCVACHLQPAADGAVIAGPHDLPSAPHAIRYDPDFSSPARCISCHQLDAPPLTRLERPLSDTHGEHDRWQQQTGRADTCADCHMPAITRPLMQGFPPRPGRQHTFPGGTDTDFLRAALDVRVDLSGAALVLHNLAGHNLPTSEPARAVEIQLEWFEQADIIQYATRSPVPVTSRSVWLERRIRLPQLIEEADTTLLPDETRRIPLAAPPEAGRWAALRIAVRYHRLRNLPDAAPFSDQPVVTLWEQTIRAGEISGAGSLPPPPPPPP